MSRASFSLDDARRIANVVRAVEEGDRNEAPLRFRRVETGGKGSAVQIGTFEGDWSTGEFKTVTFYGITSTPNTASVLNLSVPIVSDSQTLFVSFSKVKYTSDFVAIELEQPQGCMRLAGYDLTQISDYSSSVTQILGHDGSCLQWFSVTTCATATASV